MRRGCGRTRGSSGPRVSSPSVEELRKAHRPYARYRLQRDGPRHFRVPSAAVYEDDRHLRHSESVANGPKSQLYLEGIARRSHSRQADGLKHLSPKALEAARQIAHAHAQDRSRVEVRAQGNQPPAETPAHGAPASHTAPPNYEVGVLRPREHLRQISRVMGEIRVHLHHELVTIGQGAGERRQVGATQAFLSRAVEHLYALFACRDLVCETSCPIGRIVVYDQ